MGVFTQLASNIKGFTTLCLCVLSERALRNVSRVNVCSLRSTENRMWMIAAQEAPGHSRAVCSTSDECIQTQLDRTLIPQMQTLSTAWPGVQSTPNCH